MGCQCSASRTNYFDRTTISEEQWEQKLNEHFQIILNPPNSIVHTPLYQFSIDNFGKQQTDQRQFIINGSYLKK